MMSSKLALFLQGAGALYPTPGLGKGTICNGDREKEPSFETESAKAVSPAP